jgi:uncharacterized membrane protein YjjP (DUF1212 family)
VTTPAPQSDGKAGVDVDALLEFMYRLGQAYLASGEQTPQVELTLRRIATAYGMRRARVVAFPTAIFISVHDGTSERVTLSEGATQTLHLDQIGDVFALGSAAQKAEIRPGEGLERLSGILRRTGRFGRTGIVVGNAVLTLGLALVLTPSPANLVAAFLLGAMVGGIKMLNRDRAVLSVPTPVIAAALVSGLVFLGVEYGLPLSPAYLLVPPLVTFLPGAMLTYGMVELAYGDLVSGSSRLIGGLVQLVLLAIGLAAGAMLVGTGATDLPGSAPAVVSMPWLPWAGVLVFALGAAIHFSAPRNALFWLLLVVLSAFAAQRGAAAVFGVHASGFFGALVATPLAYLIQLRFNGPPAAVTFLPSFWLLVPGSLGLLSVTRMFRDRESGLDELVVVIFSVVSIALGTLVGASMYRWLTERFGWWQLQLGRVGSYFRRDSQRRSGSTPRDH